MLPFLYACRNNEVVGNASILDCRTANMDFSSRRVVVPQGYPSPIQIQFFRQHHRLPFAL
jgi:hypothetical protein